jgi:hypothetical protein
MEGDMSTALDRDWIERVGLAAESTARSHVRCNVCEADVVPKIPSAGWYAALAGTWLFIVFVGPCCAIFPLSLVMLPPYLAIALVLVAKTSDKARRVPYCPTCEHDLPGRGL